MAKVAASSEAGLAVVTFSERALGKACVQWSGTSGTYDPSKGYRAVSGLLKIIGGTGAAARWRGSVTFKQTGLTESDTLQFTTPLSGSTGSSHGLTAACRAVTKLKGWAALSDPSGGSRRAWMQLAALSQGAAEASERLWSAAAVTA